MEINLTLTPVKLGDKFESASSLFKYFGFTAPKGGKDRKAILKEIDRFLEFEKIGSLNKKGNISDEIVITQIHLAPKDKADNRSENGKTGKYIDLLKPFLLTVDSNWYTTGMLMEKLGLVESKNILDTTFIKNKELICYKRLLKGDFYQKVISALQSLGSEMNPCDFCWFPEQYVVVKENDVTHFKLADERDKAVIEEYEQRMEQKYFDEYHLEGKELRRNRFLYSQFRLECTKVIKLLTNIQGYGGCLLIANNVEPDHRPDLKMIGRLKRELRAVYKERMEHLIQMYKEQGIYILRNSEGALALHKQIFTGG